jgi:predicted RNase H-like HicB family nuclease
MAKYVYPAQFEPNEKGGYCVNFPDVQGAYTEGKDLANSIEMAQDALCLMLYNHETRGKKIVPPTLLNNVKTPENGIVTLIACDTDYYKKYFANKSVKKTVTIPARLNFEAEKAGINFSQILKAGLEQALKQS